MRKWMLSSLLLFYAAVHLNAQIKTPATNSFADSLRYIIREFAVNYQGIQGKQLPVQQEGLVFISRKCLPGALKCIIQRFQSKEDPTASWQAAFYEGASFDDASRIYKKLCSQIKGVSFTGVDKGAISLTGKTELPDENLKFTVSSFYFKTKLAPYRYFTADVELLGNYEGWEVRLNIYSNKNAGKENQEEEADSDN